MFAKITHKNKAPETFYMFRVPCFYETGERHSGSLQVAFRNR